MGGELLALVALALLSAVVGLARLVFRIGSRAPGAALRTLGSSTRSLFGPEGPPEDLCRRILEKHRDLSRNPYGGLAFTGSGCPGRLDFISDRTEIRFELDGRANGHFEVSTASFVAQLAEDKAEDFRIRGNEDLCRRVFEADPGIPALLRGLGPSFEWTFGPAECVLRIFALPIHEEELWRWLKGAFRLLSAVPGFETAAGVQITGVPRPDLAGSLCQVCGATLGQGAVVHCRRCATPHHEDCWAYAGQCSTFACTERTAVRGAPE